MMSLPTLLNPQIPKLPTYVSLSPPLKLSSLHALNFQIPRKFYSFSPSLQSSFPIQNDDTDDQVIGDCIVFEEGVFEDPSLETDFNAVDEYDSNPNPKPKHKQKIAAEIRTENLVPDKWREVQAEINITKKERRKIAQELEFNSRVEKKKKGLLPIRSVNLEEYEAYREAKLAQLKPLVLDNPSSFPLKEEDKKEKENESLSQRVAPKNPRWAVYGRGLEDVAEFFDSGNYEPGDNKKSEGNAFSFKFSCTWGLCN